MSLHHALLFLMLVPVAAHAASDKPALDQAEITLKQMTGDARGLQYGMKWSQGAKHCEAAQANPDQPLQWKPVSAKACTQVRDFIQAHEKELEAEKIVGNRVATGSRPGVGILELPGKKLKVDLMTAPTCDVTLTHCEDPALSVSSRLGVELRNAITRELGRLPEWTGSED
jgi:hypothetical protein